MAETTTLDRGEVVTAILQQHDLADLVRQSLATAGHTEAGDADDFGWKAHRPLDGGAHLLITCEPDEMWRKMPGQATRTAISRHLNAYANTLTEAGIGAAAWGRDDRLEVLIVAESPESADEQAPAIRAYLAELNPVEKPAPPPLVDFVAHPVDRAFGLWESEARHG